MLAVGDMFVEVGQGQFHCFQHRVNRFKAVHRVFADAQCFEHGQAGQGGNALAIWREFMHHSACVGHRQGVDPVHGMRRQVVEAHHAAIGVGMGDDGLRQFAAIERFAIGLRDQFQRAGVILEPDFFSGHRGLATRHEALGKARLILEQMCAAFPQLGDNRRDLIAVASVANRRFGQGREGQFAVAR